MCHFNIIPGYTFYGILPPKQNYKHLAIVLKNKDTKVKYCYCRSSLNVNSLIYSVDDFAKIEKGDMELLFGDRAEETYIYLSKNHIIEISYSDLCSRLRDKVFEEKIFCPKIIYNEIIDKIRKSKNLSPRFKKELLDS